MKMTMKYARPQVCARVGLQPRQRTNIVGDGRNLIRLEQVVAAKGRHHACVTLVVTAARAMPDGLLNIGKLAAPEPVIVIEVWVTLRAAAASPMACLLYTSPSPRDCS